MVLGTTFMIMQIEYINAFLLVFLILNEGYKYHLKAKYLSYDVESKKKATDSEVGESLTDLIQDALITDGHHHKQYYLYKIAKKLNIDPRTDDEGIAP
jgi:hypothetical protein